MRHFSTVLGLLVVSLVFSSPTFADTLHVQYTVTGTFSPSEVSAPLTGPNGTFSISFALPQTPSPDFFDSTAGDFAIFNVPISYSFQCDGCSSATLFSGPALDVDFGTGTVGVLVIEFLTGGHDYYWQFSGTQLFSGPVNSPTLLGFGPANVVTDGQFELDSNDFTTVGNPTVTAQIPTPEPSALALLIAAMASFGLIAWIKTQRT